MKIDCISDLHGYKPKLEGGDLLIIAGDLTARDNKYEYVQFSEWFLQQDYRKKIVISGNHEGCIERGDYYFNHEWLGYLQDSGTEFEGLKIWGSPWTPEFCNWYFMKKRGKEIKEKWDLIPNDIDILITHGPPYGILDSTSFSCRRPYGTDHCGCVDLREAIERIQPKLHVFGHIHEGYGQIVLKCTPRDVLCVNASIMDKDYQPVNKPISIELK